MKRKILHFSFIVLYFSGCVSVGVGQHYDVVLYAKPFKVYPLDLGGTSEAVAKTAGEIEKPAAIVVFEVLHVSQGVYSQPVGGPSIWEQMRTAAKNKDVGGIFSYTDPKREQTQKLIRIAVADPVATFGFPAWDQPSGRRYKIYLQKAKEAPDAYYMVKVQS